LLLARRLIESGVRFVNVYAPGLADSKAFNWDDHAVNWDMPTAMRQRLPRYDHAVATLIEDIHQRGLDENVLLIVTGEFGRTPRLEYKDGNVGRDHWPYAMSVLVSGGAVSAATSSAPPTPREQRPRPATTIRMTSWPRSITTWASTASVSSWTEAAGPSP
jgi:hypothetical protein